MRLLILGDIGSGVDFHAGDEAMAEALVDEMAKRGDLSVTAISGCVDDTRTRYGWDAVPRLGFGKIADRREACEERLIALEAAARGTVDAIPWDDSAWEVIDAVSGADAIAVSGGGNLSSTWPEHVYERAALALLAEVFAKPFVVSGQTLGPHLLGRDSELIAQLLHSARIIGVREAASLDLLGRLGAPSSRATQTVDDATYLPGSEPAWSGPRGPYIAATFAPFAGILGEEIYLDLIADLLERAIEKTGCDVVLIPHQGGVVDGVQTDDLAFHLRIADAVGGARVHQAPMMTAAEVAAMTRGASLVISSRYHPVVFGLSGSVPSVGIGVDAYTSTKIKGAMANYGVSAFHVSPAAFAHGDAIEVVADAWARVEELGLFLDSANTVRKSEAEAWWDAVHSVLSGGSAEPAPASLSDLEAAVSGSAVAGNTILERWSAQLGNQLATLNLGTSESAQSLEAAEKRISELEMRLAETEASLNDAHMENSQLHDSAAAAQALAGDLLSPIVVAMTDTLDLAAAEGRVASLAHRLAASEGELMSLLETRLLRYSRRPRAIYSRMRRG